MDNKKTFLSTHLALILVFILIIIPDRSASQSLLWKISGNSLPAPSYLYGTIHLKDKRVFEWRDTVYARLGACQTFAGELDLSMENIMKASVYLMLPEGQTLHDRFTVKEYELVKAAVKSCSGYELALFDKLKPISLIALCFSGNGQDDMEATVDELLYRKAVEGGKQVIGLETLGEQAALLDKIPDNYVLEYFMNLDEQQEEFDNLIRCYRKADLDSLWLMMQDEESGSLLNEEMIRARNFRMTERMIPLIRKQSTFVAIGSGHLPGVEGVIALLRKEGYHLEPEKIAWEPYK